MTRKDYELIARVLRNSSEIMDEFSLDALIDNFIEELADTNPNFNGARFRAAAGMTPTKRREILASLEA